MAYQSYDMLGEVLFERVEDADAVRVYGVNHKEVRSMVVILKDKHKG